MSKRRAAADASATSDASAATTVVLPASFAADRWEQQIDLLRREAAQIQRQCRDKEESTEQRLRRKEIDQELGVMGQ
jgi:hypothetical protein